MEPLKELKLSQHEKQVYEQYYTKLVEKKQKFDTPNMIKFLNLRCNVDEGVSETILKSSFQQSSDKQYLDKNAVFIMFKLGAAI